MRATITKGDGSLRMNYLRWKPSAIGKYRRRMEELKNKNRVYLLTGGIRCEKASALWLRKDLKMFTNDGGILEYITSIL